MKHALVIEDNHLIAMMIQEELADRGYGLIENATSQRQAIGMALARCPDLITVDDKLDTGTGLDSILEICRHQAIPVVFISADPEAIETAIPDAVVIRKPFSDAQFSAAIEAALRSPFTLKGRAGQLC